MDGILPDRLVIAAVISFLVTLVVTPIVREVARYRSMLDAPNSRSSHSVPVPRLGGVGILLGTLFGVSILTSQVDAVGTVVGFALLVMVTMGLVDDVRTIGAREKYIPQLVASVIVAYWLSPSILVALPGWEWRVEGLVSILMTTLFILVVVNAMNFMDGIDGIAGGLGIIISLAALLFGEFSSLTFLLPLIASLAGFLCWNISPASIFMGDGGSQFVGFLLAVALLYRVDQEVNIVPVLICLLPVLTDTGFTIVRRLINKQNIFEGHREHLYQRLVASGYVHRSVANLYYALTLACFVLAYAYREGGPLDQLLVLLASALAITVFITGVIALERQVIQISVVMPSSLRNNIHARNESHSDTTNVP